MNWAQIIRNIKLDYIHFVNLHLYIYREYFTRHFLFPIKGQPETKMFD
jgi:hypothetical protein